MIRSIVYYPEAQSQSQMFSTHSCSQKSLSNFHLGTFLSGTEKMFKSPISAGASSQDYLWLSKSGVRRYQLPGKIFAAMRKIFCKQDQTQLRTGWKFIEIRGPFSTHYTLHITHYTLLIQSYIGVRPRREFVGWCSVFSNHFSSYPSPQKVRISYFYLLVSVLVSNSPDTLSYPVHSTALLTSWNWK